MLDKFNSVFILLFLLVLCVSIAEGAQKNESYPFVHTEFDQMDKIGSPFKNQSWYNYKSKDSYDGPINREVFMSGQLNTDETVLVANKHYSIPVGVNNILQELSNQIREMEYDPRPTTPEEARPAFWVAKHKKGNCYEIAQYAQQVLEVSGYDTRLVNLKTGNSTNWHTVCAFKERDGTWSFFQAAGGKYMGYFPIHANDIGSMLRLGFSNITDYIIN